jgi:glucokinase
LDAPATVAIGVDIGGTEIKIACVGPDGTVHARSVTPTDARISGSHLLQQTVRLLRQAIDERSTTQSVAAVGLSVPGVIDRPSGRIELTVALTEEWNGYAAGPAVAAEIGRPVVLMNDAQAAAEGELRAGSGRGFQHFLSITVGTGIGGGLVLDGKLYEGSRGMSGVIGHTTVVPDGLTCGCGNRGCLETVASGQAIARAARAAVESGRWHPDLPVEALDPRSIAALGRSGDRIARELYTDAGTVLGMALANVICLLNLEAVVVGGGVARAGDLLLDPIREEIARRTTVFTPERGGVTVVQSTLDGFAGAVGTALGALRMVHANDGGGSGDD